MTALPTLVRPALPEGTWNGFVWWYVDLVDDTGNGLVAIVSLGLPFLPRPRVPGTRPNSQRASICVATVVDGRPDFWALHEVDPDDVWWTPTSVRIGDSTVEVTVGPHGVRFSASLRGKLPGCPWQADIRVEGPKRRPSHDEPATGAHEWSVVTAVARGEATLQAGGASFALSGRAYVDRNAADQPLDRLAIRDWTWGRLAYPDHERVWYSAVDETGKHRSLDLRFAADGVTTTVRDQVMRVGQRRGRWGLPYPATIALDDALSVSLRRPIDDSPFYARFPLSVPHEGKRVHGFAEICRPGKLDAAWFRPLHRMAVCNDHSPGDNSVWLPLFTGPMRGRWSRLLGAT